MPSVRLENFPFNAVHVLFGFQKSESFVAMKFVRQLKVENFSRAWRVTFSFARQFDKKIDADSDGNAKNIARTGFPFANVAAEVEDVNQIEIFCEMLTHPVE